MYLHNVETPWSRIRIFLDINFFFTFTFKKLTSEEIDILSNTPCQLPKSVLRNAWYIGRIHTSSCYLVIGILKILSFLKKPSCFCCIYPELSAVRTNLGYVFPFFVFLKKI